MFRNEQTRPDKPTRRHGHPGRVIAVALLAVSAALTALTAPAAPASAAATSDAAAPLPWPAHPNWRQYVQAPTSRHVTPVRVVSATGNVTNPQALVHPGHGQTTLTRERIGLADDGPDSWPAGTTATASSYHTCCSNHGYSFVPSNALDGNPATYWNNATAGSTHSWLEITTPSPITVRALTLLFSSNGVPVDFQIQTWDPTTTSWVTQVSVTGNSSTEVARLFPNPVTTEHVRIYITLDQATTYGQYSRIAEVYPYYSPPADIVLDYGKDVGGLPTFDVTAETGDPTLEAGYSEAKRFISPTGDMGDSGPFGSGDPHRYDTYRVTGPGVIVNRFVQGGERYQELSLATPGSITLRAVWIHFEPFLGTPSTFKGFFVSSSALLNKLWYDGAYTVNLVQMRPGTPGGYWVIENGSLDAQGGGTGLLKQGTSWTDYEMSFETSIVADQAGWAVRAQATDTKYLLILDSGDDMVGPKNTVQELVDVGGTYHVIADVPLPFTVTPDTWYAVRTVVSGSTVTTSIDGTQVASFDSASLPTGVSALASGTVGFREDSGGTEHARFRDLAVTAPDGATLFASPLNDSSDLAAFNVPGTNALPVVLDGAKRDRAVWEGDLSVSGPTLYYSSDATQYLRDSLKLLGSYQLSSGFIEGVQTPATPVHTGPPIPGTVASYSASYSMYWVVNLATYYRFTGDRTFIRQEWPIVQRELAWNASQVDSQGLFVTDSSDGANWHYTDLSGAQTYYNALYYRTLLDAATLADATGHRSAAVTYRQRAVALKKAINTYLFDPSTGVYNVSTTQTGYVPQDANVFAILYGIAPRNKVAGILKALQNRLSTPYGALDVSSPAPAGYGQLIGPFMGSYELWAMLAAHDTTGALQLMRTEWGPMTVHGPGDTIWETMGTDGSISGSTSLAHGWSTGPTSALSAYILGARPVTAGYATWLVAPHPGSLAWAEGAAPTPHGPLTVKWGHQTRQGRFVMDVTAPSATTGTIAVPTFGRQLVIHVNGRLVWNNGRFHAVPGVTAARLSGHDVFLTVDPARTAGDGFLIDAKVTGTAP